jgi:hypothetical protein
MEFFRGLVPRRSEVLSGAIVETVDGKISKASSQLDVIVVDTFEYPTLLRTGDLAIVLPDSVRVVVEAKSDLERGQNFFDALEQIGQARLLAGAGVLTALFCFGSPAKSKTLREWLNEAILHRTHLAEWAVKVAELATKGETLRPEETSEVAAKDGTVLPEQYKKATKEKLLAIATALSAVNLPDLVLTDKGAIAMRADNKGKTSYKFFGTKIDPRTKENQPTVVALASKVLAHVSSSAATAANSTQISVKVLIEHYESALQSTDLEDLDVTDTQPDPGTV